MGNKQTDNYLYKNFALVHVNTAKELGRRAHPLVSAAVLAGGVLVALTLFLLQKSVSSADHIVSTGLYDATALVEDVE